MVFKIKICKKCRASFVPIKDEDFCYDCRYMKCKLCKGKLGGQNKSGYCTKCYPKSPQYLEYQRIKQNEFYYKYKDRKKAYRNRPDIKKRTKEYNKKYAQEHKAKLRVQKREWARKNKLNNHKSKII